ncbi:SseB family protein [Flexivirga sp. ID2601S]|uniref:SseB family protein n=1 Tax=Flexivirga aerilata TaxID=1656889 RepID=A0A849AMU6_9MICO|nr:SseB family protein [Flexivirga aerilata]
MTSGPANGQDGPAAGPADPGGTAGSGGTTGAADQGGTAGSGGAADPGGTAGAADSAGQTFAGRSLAGTGFDGDDGSVDAGLAAALADRTDERRLMAALAGARLLVPVVAAPTEVDDSGEHAVEKTTDMAVVTLTAQSGERALPVFSDVVALAAWDPAARPSPVTAALAAQAAVGEQCDVMVLDVASPQPLVLRPSMVWALAQRHEWLPPYLDQHVQQALRKAVADEPDVAEARGEAGAEPGELRVVLSVLPGLTQQELQALARRVGETVATDGEARARIDGLAFAIVAAPTS